MGYQLGSGAGVYQLYADVADSIGGFGRDIRERSQQAEENIYRRQAQEIEQEQLAMLQEEQEREAQAVIAETNRQVSLNREAARIEFQRQEDMRILEQGYDESAARRLASYPTIKRDESGVTITSEPPSSLDLQRMYRLGREMDSFASYEDLQTYLQANPEVAQTTTIRYDSTSQQYVLYQNQNTGQAAQTAAQTQNTIERGLEQRATFTGDIYTNFQAGIMPSREQIALLYPDMSRDAAIAEMSAQAGEDLWMHNPVPNSVARQYLPAEVYNRMINPPGEDATQAEWDSWYTEYFRNMRYVENMQSAAPLLDDADRLVMAAMDKFKDMPLTAEQLASLVTVPEGFSRARLNYLASIQAQRYNMASQEEIDEYQRDYAKSWNLAILRNQLNMQRDAADNDSTVTTRLSVNTDTLVSQKALLQALNDRFAFIAANMGSDMPTTSDILDMEYGDGASFVTGTTWIDGQTREDGEEAALIARAYANIGFRQQLNDFVNKYNESSFMGDDAQEQLAEVVGLYNNLSGTLGRMGVSLPGIAEEETITTGGVDSPPVTPQMIEPTGTTGLVPTQAEAAAETPAGAMPPDVSVVATPVESLSFGKYQPIEEQASARFALPEYQQVRRGVLNLLIRLSQRTPQPSPDEIDRYIDVWFEHNKSPMMPLTERMRNDIAGGAIAEYQNMVGGNIQ